MARWWMGAGANICAACVSGWPAAHQRVAQALESEGFELFSEPKAGLFLWARHPDIQNAAELAYKAAEQDILLGPGHLFDPQLAAQPLVSLQRGFHRRAPGFGLSEGPATSLTPENGFGLLAAHRRLASLRKYSGLAPPTPILQPSVRTSSRPP